MTFGQPQDFFSQEVASQEGRAFLFKGPFASGKTIAAASANDPIDYIDWDQNMAGIRTYYTNRQKEFKLATLPKIFPKRYGPQDILDFINDGLGNIVTRNPNNARTVIIDSLTTLLRDAVSFQMQPYWERWEREGGKKKTEVPIASWDEWKGEVSVISIVLAKLKAIQAKGIDIIVTCHPTKAAAPTAGAGGAIASVQTKVSPIVVMGLKAAELIPMAFHEQYHFATRTDAPGQPPSRLCYTQNVGDDFARTGYNLPSEINWTNKHFFSSLNRLIEFGKLGNDWTKPETGKLWQEFKGE